MAINIKTKEEAYEWIENTFFGDLDEKGMIENLKYMVDGIFRGIENKDPLHRLNSLIRDYCLKREFDKRYPHNDWFTVQIICKSKDYRGLMVIPEVKDSFFEKKIFEATTTKDMFDKAIKFYKEKV